MMFLRLHLYLTTLIASSFIFLTRSHPMESGDDEDLVPEKDVESVCNTLRTVDAKLTEIMTKLPEDSAGDVFKLMKTYNEASKILLQHCKSDKFTAFPPAKDLLERGGPEFLDVDVNESDLETTFSWEKDDLQNMQNLKKRTNILWYDLWRLYNNIPIPDS